jgi:hypothetical protein
VPDVGDHAALALEHDDLGMLSVELGQVRVDLELAEPPPQVTVGLGREGLIGEEHDEVVAQGAPQLVEAPVVEVAEVETPDLGPEGTGDGPDGDLLGDLVGGHAPETNTIH